MRQILRFLVIAMLAVNAGVAFGQGSTTASISGKVIDETGQPVPGATVLAVDKSNGSQFGNVTGSEGFFRIANMKVGGPYKITVSFVGYSDFVRDNVFLSLGQNLKIDVNLKEESTALDEVIVVGDKNGIFNGEKGGAETLVGKELVATLPNVTRDLSDFTRLTPQASATAGGGISIAGQNNRYNAIFIDGAVNNDVFGLSGNGQNGGQIGISPISIDAIEQFQVVVSPYDVTLGGFAGGGINAVTRSGNNNFEGSLYYLLRNQSFAGKTPSVIGGDRAKLDDFSAKTYGFRLGGPVIKNKLFFFVNAELQRDETPQPFNFDNYNGGGGAAASRADIDGLVSKLQNDYGYNPGSFEDVTDELNGEKFLIKLDWNISKKHKLSMRHSYTNGESLNRNTSNASQVRFANSGIFFPSVTNSTAIELKSNFTNSSNTLILGYTTVKDNRDPIGSPFPFVKINNPNIAFGSDQFSTGNLLEQKIFTLTNNFNLYKGNHTFTFGTHNEIYDMNNVFIRQNFGYYEYNNLSDFMNDESAVEFARSYSLVDNVSGDATSAAAAFKAMQLGFYAQDEIQVNDRFTLTAGIRLDIPMFLDDPKSDPSFNSTTIPQIESFGYDLKGAKAGQAPGARLMLSPRVGFNLDLDGDKTTQLRGGVGVFTSRVPFVWPGGMFNNNGVSVGGAFAAYNPATDPDSDKILFNSDPFNQPTIGDFGGVDAVPQGQMDLFVEDFKFPQIFRTSLAIDQKLPLGLIGTVELMYSKTLNNIFYENVNLKPSVENAQGADGRPLFDRRDEIDSKYSRILLASNTSKGYTYNLTAQIQKPFSNGWTASLAYTYGDAYSVYEGTSSQNSSQWRGSYSVQGRNSTPLGRSDFSMGSRIVGMASYRLEYAKNFATTFSFFYNGQSGSSFSYITDDNFNNEDSRQRALIYVPLNSNQIRFEEYEVGPVGSEITITVEEQWAAFNQFIDNEKALDNRRGDYAERNGSRTPFESILDFKVMQEFYLNSESGMGHTLQVGLDIFNFGNFLNKDWGRRYFAPNGNVSLLDLRGLDADNIPTYRFNPEIKDKKDLLTADDNGIISSRWQMQLSLRYSF